MGIKCTVTVIPEMKTIAKSTPFIILLLLLILQLCLAFVPERARLVVWYGSQIYMPVIGIVTIIATLIFVARRKRWRSRRGWATIVVAGAAITAAVLPIVLGFPYPARLASAESSLAVRVPIDGPVLVGWGGDKAEINYHVSEPDQRWAYDLVVAPAFTGSKRLTDYGCYNRPVLAPTAGVVVRVHDGERDSIPTETPFPSAGPAGNHILLRPDDAAGIIEMAHLKPASITVRVGQRVTEGQIIGACGNSGNSSEPHLHFHYARYLQPPSDPDALSYGLPLYFRDNTGPAFPSGGFDANGRPSGDTVTNIGR